MPKLLWEKGAKDEDLLGTNLFNMFDAAIKLTKNKRVDQLQLNGSSFLERLRGGMCDKSDWEKVSETCDRHSMSAAEWEQRGFNDENCVHLYVNNKLVQAHHNQQLTAQGNPIALIRAQHSHSAAARKSADKFWGLETLLYACVGAHVMLHLNLCSKAGLVNGASGVVKDIVYEEGENAATDLPLFIVVDIPTYTGPSFFPMIRHAKPGYQSRDSRLPIQR